VVRLTITAPVRPTEDPQKVAAACTAFWDDVTLQVGTDQVVAEASDLQSFRNRIWELRIIDTVRGQLLDGANGDRLRFTLSKQAALHQRISFPPTPHALGDLQVEVTLAEDDPWLDAEGLAWWLCPATEDGEIVGPTDP
jgi:predicted RNA binding protein with dsRBD fold (UPF0201 family)